VTYEAVLAALGRLERFGIRLGLDAVRAACAELGHPERAFRVVHVAGTNGKGTTAATVAALAAHGLTTGLATSPHVVDLRERIRIDGRPIGREETAAAWSRIAPLLEPRGMTYFEATTLLAFVAFAEAGVELAAVEVGLGGRLDATHAWDGGVAVITNVDLDHMDRLGDTITAIAREKAAIIERGDIAATAARGDGLAVIRRRARRMAVPLTEVVDPPLLGWDRDGLEVDLPRLGPTRIGLRGRHQAVNAATADALLDVLETAGIATVPDAARRTGYATAVWPGRLELVRVRGHDVLLDGAHNPAGAAALAVALNDLRPFLQSGPLTIVTASMADKDVDGVVAALASSDALASARIVCTAIEAARAMPAAELADRWRARAFAPLVEPDPIAAVEIALDGRGPVVVAGSLYLVGVARGHLVDDPELRDPAQAEDA
jgi:dihydrofolate synthase / folylpolyglutamate synthase